MAAPFKQVDKALQVGVRIGIRMIDRMAYAGLRGEMHHRAKFCPREKWLHRRAVGHIGADELEPGVLN